MKSSYTRIGEKKVFFKTKIEGEGGERETNWRPVGSVGVHVFLQQRAEEWSVSWTGNVDCYLPVPLGSAVVNEPLQTNYSKNKAAICLAVSTADSRRRQIFSSFPPTPSMPPPWHKPCNLPPPLTPVSWVVQSSGQEGIGPIVCFLTFITSFWFVHRQRRQMTCHERCLAASRVIFYPLLSLSAFQSSPKQPFVSFPKQFKWMRCEFWDLKSLFVGGVNVLGWTCCSVISPTLWHIQTNNLLGR